MSIMKRSELLPKLFNPIKNIFQYLIGSILYFLTFNNFNLLNFFFGLLGFVIAYQSVYYYNDLMDYEEDKRDKLKNYKPLVKGEYSKEMAQTLAFLLSILGLSISFFVNVYFGLFVSIALFLNFLHSSPLIRLKKMKLSLPNLFLIEFIKFSLGWFVMSFSFYSFPFFMIAMLSTLYLVGFAYYKQNALNFFRSNNIRVLCGISIILYEISFFIYSFKLALLVPLPILFCFLILRRINDISLRFKVGGNLFYVIIICFIVSMLLLNVPSVAEINNNLNLKVDAIKENVTKIIPENMKSEISSINRTINEKISKIEDIIKV